MDDPRRVNAAGNQVHLTGLTLCRGLGRAAPSLSQPAEVGAVSGAALAMRRDLFMTLGGFDASFFMYFEDTDLSMRARLASARCLYVPEAIVYHDYRLRFGPLKTYYEERNRYITLLKLYRWPTLLLLLPSLLLGEVVSWGFTLLRDRARWANKLRAYAHIIRHWRYIMARRRRVQAARRLPDRALLQATVARLAFEQTGDGFVARAAHLLFNPLFYLQRKLLGALLPW
jgi:GT2 family glycosyltransferase